MPHCPKCGKEVKEGTKFCTECGAPITAEAPAKAPERPMREPAAGPRRIGAAGAAAVVAVIAVVVVAVYFLFLRGGPSFGTPEGTVETLADAINDRDADLIYSCFSSQVQGGTSVQEIENAINGWNAMNYHISGVEVSNVNITGDNATATVKATFSYTNPYTGEPTTDNSSEAMSFVKEGGEWKINEEFF